MFVASYANGYGNVDKGFDTEAAADKWLADEQRRTGSRLGVVYWIEGEVA